MKKCEHKSLSDIRCLREVYDGSFCILHSKDEKKDPKIFERIFRDELKKQIKKNDFICLEEILFPVFFSFEKIPPIDNQVSFWGSIFCGLADFSNVVFNDNCSFLNVEFRCSVSFRDVVFKKDVSFRNCILMGTICFLRTNFLGSVSFLDAEFKDNDESQIDCMTRDFPGYGGSQELGKIFGYTEGFSFSGAIFKGRSTFLLANFSGLNIDFSDSQILGEFDFNASLEIKKMNLTNADIVGKSNFSFHDRKSVLIDAENAYFDDERGLFKDIKRSQLVSYKFVFGEKTASRFPLIAREARDSWYLDNFKKKHLIIYFMWKYTSNCGRSLLRWSFASLVVVLLFAFLYWNVGQEGFVHKSDMHYFSYFYFSIVTFTTLGFGDIAPSSLIAQVFVIVEVILGYVLLGGLISIFSNKLARRS